MNFPVRFKVNIIQYHKHMRCRWKKTPEPISLTYLWAAIQWNEEYGDATCLFSPCEKLPSYWISRKGSESEKGSLCARRDDHKIARLSSSIALGGYPGAFIIMFVSSHWGSVYFTSGQKDLWVRTSRNALDWIYWLCQDPGGCHSVSSLRDRSFTNIVLFSHPKYFPCVAVSSWSACGILVLSSSEWI